MPADMALSADPRSCLPSAPSEWEGRGAKSCRIIGYDYEPCIEDFGLRL